MFSPEAKLSVRCWAWSEKENDVRFTPESGHVQGTSSCLLWARSGHAAIQIQFSREEQSPGSSLLFDLETEFFHKVAPLLFFPVNVGCVFSWCRRKWIAAFVMDPRFYLGRFDQFA